MNLNFTRFVLFSVMALAIVATASAQPACPQTALAPTYVQSTGQEIGLMNPGYVCDVGNLQFSNFAYSFTPDPATPPNPPPNTDPVAPVNVTVVPQNTPGDQGLEFTGAFATGGVNPNSVEDLDVSFTVTALTGSISALTINLGTPSISGNGDVKYTETFCMTNNTCSTFVEDSSLTSFFNTTVQLSSTALGGPQTSLNITKDVEIMANGGEASISNFANVYTNSGVPEPRGLSLLLCLSLIGGLVLFKRRQAARS